MTKMEGHFAPRVELIADNDADASAARSRPQFATSSDRVRCCTAAGFFSDRASLKWQVFVAGGTNRQSPHRAGKPGRCSDSLCASRWRPPRLGALRDSDGVDEAGRRRHQAFASARTTAKWRSRGQARSNSFEIAAPPGGR